MWDKCYSPEPLGAGVMLVALDSAAVELEAEFKTGMREKRMEGHTQNTEDSES